MTGGPTALSGEWLLVVAEGLRDETWVSLAARAFEAQGASVVVCELDTGEPDAVVFASRLRAALHGRAVPAGVVSLLALDERPLPTGLVARGVAATLALVQALGEAGYRRPVVAGHPWCGDRGTG